MHFQKKKVRVKSPTVKISAGPKFRTEELPEAPGAPVSAPGAQKMRSMPTNLGKNTEITNFVEMQKKVRLVQILLFCALSLKLNLKSKQSYSRKRRYYRTLDVSSQKKNNSV
uniref:Uncharacterized protein n=1 Tax=Lutzomyia longipalpis TaxID=7200 RepID=A0A1B0CQG3_LUTLO